MLEFVEGFIRAINRIKSNQDAEAVLRRIADACGLRDAVLFEYARDLSEIVNALDTNEERRAAWPAVFKAGGLQRSVDSTRWMLQRGQVVRFDESRFDANHPFLPTVRRLDLVDGWSVPVVDAEDVAGVINFSGTAALSEIQIAGLHIVGYLLFVRVRSLRGFIPRPSQAALTPREKEVMAMSSMGHTSSQIATVLGMAERTVNAHVDNVAAKFGTKNRTHSVAELVRLNLLH